MDILRLKSTTPTLFVSKEPNVATIIWCADDTYPVGGTIMVHNDAIITNGLDGFKVSLLDGRVYILDFVAATRSREAHYRTRCHTHRLNLDGTSTCRSKYNIDQILGPC